jgi:hypothetical protein
LCDVAAREYGFPPEATGLVLALTGYDEFARQFPDRAHGLLDIFAVRSCGATLSGQHLICLVRSNDPHFSPPPVGATLVLWNDSEWLNASRGL